MTDVTQVLSQIEDGDPSAAEKLLPLVYEELRKLASQKLRNEKPGQTLQATALVHEAYLRLVGNGQDEHWDGRGHFFAAAAESMRRIVIDNAKQNLALKRGGDRKREEISDIAAPLQSNQLLAMDEALDRLSESDPQVAELVKLRYFAGFTIKDSAEILGISIGTANNYWSYAKSWLIDAIA